MHIVYIALMILALIGMIVCSKKQKTNPAMQPVAFVLFVVVVISAGLLLNEMNVFGTRDGLLENEMKFYASQGTKTGDYLKTTFPGKKVLLVADPGFEKNDNVKKLADALQAGYGGEVVTDTVQLPGNQADAPMPLYMMMKAADFDAMVDKHPDCGVIVDHCRAAAGRESPEVHEAVGRQASGAVPDGSALRPGAGDHGGAAERHHHGPDHFEPGCEVRCAGPVRPDEGVRYPLCARHQGKCGSVQGAFLQLSFGFLRNGVTTG